ncbi:MAG: hypothetical protein ACREB3_15420, partial [Burkholderiales bacterium]
TKSGNNLVLNVNATDKLTFSNWYAAPANRSVGTLQVIAEAMAAFDAQSSDPLLNKKVQSFDFDALVDAFDAAGQVSGWALTNALLASHLAVADDSAIGGDLAYQYGLNGNFNNVGSTGAQNVLSSSSFGTAPQTFQSSSTLQQGISLAG